MPRRFPTVSGRDASRLVFGAWAIGGAFTGHVSDKESLAALEYAYEQGISFYDTSPVYGEGHSERLLGAFARHKREHLFIATKAGMAWSKCGGKRLLVTDSSAEALKQSLDVSLNHLQTEYIDLFQIHWPDASVPFDETFSTLEELRAQRKIRFIGVSNFTLSQLKKALTYANIDSVQNQYNLLSQSAKNEFFPFLNAHHTAFLAYGSLAYGLLSGKFHPGHVFAKNDWRKQGGSPTNDYFKEPAFSTHVQQAVQLVTLSQSVSCTAAQMAIAWVLHNPITYALVGAKTIKQVKENIEGKVVFSDVLLHRLEKIFVNT